MVKNINKRVLIILIILFLITTIIVMLFNLYDLNKKSNILTEDSLFAIMVEDGYQTNNYIDSDMMTFPTSGYIFNSEKSHCINGSIMTWNNELSNITINTTGSEKCYTYFDVVLPNIKSLEVVKTDSTEYIPGSLTDQNVIITPVPVHDIIVKYEYSLDNINWNEWPSDSESLTFTNRYNGEIYVRGYDKNGVVGESISALVNLVTYCTGWYANETNLRPSDNGQTCTNIDTSQSSSQTVYKFRMRVTSPAYVGGQTSCWSIGSGNYQCACTYGTDTGAGSGWYGTLYAPNECGWTFAYNNWQISSSCYAAKGPDLNSGSCSAGYYERTSTTKTLYKWYKYE